MAFGRERNEMTFPAPTYHLPPATCHLRPLSIGRVQIAFPVVQAALSGYSDWPMRVIARRLGAAYTLAEVLLDKFVLDVSKGSKARRHLRVSDEEHPCGAQLMGAEPEQFPPAALRLVAGRLRRDRPEFRLPGEEGPGPLPRADSC